MARILTITSGKGGVGKTNISVNLAIHLAQKGHKTCLFDADLGLANINILLGIYPEYNLKDVIDGTKALTDIIIHDKSGIDIIPGSSGVAEMEALSSAQLDLLTSAFSKLEAYDYFIFDTSAGVSKSVIAFCMSASEVILVITPEPTSLTDAYALMKILSINGYQKPTKVLVNQSKNSKIAQVAYKKLKDTTHKFLGLDLTPLGTVVADPRVNEAVSAQQPFITLYPKTQASRCIKAIGEHIQGKDPESGKEFPLDSFWKRCIDIFSTPLKMPVKKEKSSQKETSSTDEQPRDPKQQPPAVSEGKAVPESPVDNSREAKKKSNDDFILPRDANQQSMERLIEKISSVSEELSGIRKLLETGALNAPRFDPTVQNTGGPFPLIPLDFEAFLAEKENNN